MGDATVFVFVASSLTHALDVEAMSACREWSRILQRKYTRTW